MESITSLVPFAGRFIARRFSDALAEAGSSLPTFLVLKALHRSERGSQHELARAVGIRGATLTSRLDRLEGAGLVIRTPDPHDRRSNRVELTEAGERLFERLDQAAKRFYKEAVRDVTEEQISQVEVILRQILKNLAKENKS